MTKDNITPLSSHSRLAKQNFQNHVDNLLEVAASLTIVREIYSRKDATIGAAIESALDLIQQGYDDLILILDNLP
jgi:hypothetical protein